MLDKIRVLGVAPYEGMQLLMQKVAEGFPQIELTALVGDLHRGVSLAQANFHSDYDVIISRGGTAELLRKDVDLPVIEIPITEYDILRTLHLVENVSKDFAIVGFPSVTGNATYLSEILSFTPGIYTIHDPEQVEDIIEQVWNEGYRTVLCDVVATVAAKKRGMNAILITSGHESIAKTYQEAFQLYHNIRHLKAENRFLREVISEQSNETVVFDKDKNLYFSTVNSGNQTALLGMLRDEIDNCDASSTRRLVKSLDGSLYSIKAQRFSADSGSYTTFYFSRSKTPFSLSRSGICHYSLQEAEQVFYNGFYSSAGDIIGFEDEINKIIKSDRPVMLIGEAGTGKNYVATLLYTRSILNNHPFITINCALLNEKSWEYLQSNHNSPLTESQVTIYISQIEVLTPKQQSRLLAMLMDMDICIRNRLIFSSTLESGSTSMSEIGRIFADKLCVLTLTLPTLREQKNRIPALINLYLGQFNVLQGNDVIGMEDSAMEKMCGFSWPHNLEQFKRVLQELSTTARLPLISLSEVNEVLKLESSSPAVLNLQSAPERFDLNRTLSEMDSEIVKRVLEECDNNQTTAAKRLGISRTTLWRYCKIES